jgi:hypothetical protein
LKIPTNNTFTSPDTSDEDNFLIKLDGAVVDLVHAASCVYKKNDGSTTSANKYFEGDYTPTNIAGFPNYLGASIQNPHGYSIVQPSV